MVTDAAIDAAADDETTELQSLADRLVREVASYRSAAVALSGGVDSAVVAAAAVRALGKAAVAITAQSPSVAMREREDAARIAALTGIRHTVLPTDEFASDAYRANSGDRCFHCKSTLYDAMSRWAAERGIESLVSGTNADDLGDYRPGLRAAAAFAVRHPLAELGISKASVRRLARLWNLPVADKPASPCLSSRLAVGVPATPERVQRIEQAEALVRAIIGDRPLRVREEASDLARLELPVDCLPHVMDTAIREPLTDQLKALGYRAVTIDLEGFRSGSLNVLVPLAMHASDAPSLR